MSACGRTRPSSPCTTTRRPKWTPGSDPRCPKRSDLNGHAGGQTPACPKSPHKIRARSLSGIEAGFTLQPATPSSASSLLLLTSAATKRRTPLRKAPRLLAEGIACVLRPVRSSQKRPRSVRASRPYSKGVSRRSKMARLSSVRRSAASNSDSMSSGDQALRNAFLNREPREHPRLAWRAQARVVHTGGECHLAGRIDRQPKAMR